MRNSLKLDDMSNTEFILEQVDDIRDYLDGVIEPFDEIPGIFEAKWWSLII